MPVSYTHLIGFADFTSQKCFSKIDFSKTYPNCLTNKVIGPAKIPPIMPNDLLAVKAAFKTAGATDPLRARAIRIKNTRDLERLYITPALFSEYTKSTLYPVSTALPLRWSPKGTLLPMEF